VIILIIEALEARFKGQRCLRGILGEVQPQWRSGDQLTEALGHIQFRIGAAAGGTGGAGLGS